MGQILAFMLYSASTRKVHNFAGYLGPLGRITLLFGRTPYLTTYVTNLHFICAVSPRKVSDGTPFKINENNLALSCLYN